MERRERKRVAGGPAVKPREAGGGGSGREKEREEEERCEPGSGKRIKE